MLDLEAIFMENSEVRLMRYFEPKPGIFIAETPKVIERALNAGYEPLGLLICEDELHEEGRRLVARMKDVPTLVYTSEEYKRLKGAVLTNGCLCAMLRREAQPLEALLAGASARRIAVLDNVENPQNVGSIFRAAAALGIDACLVANGSSDPLYRRALRVSMGTVLSIPWTYAAPGDSSYVESLKANGFTTVAMALKDNSFSISDPLIADRDKLAIILGNEGEGLSDEVLAKVDYTVKLPMYHDVDSLNVSQAAAISFWELGKK